MGSRRLRQRSVRGLIYKERISQYFHDTLNRLATLKDFSNGTSTFSYDALGRRTNLARPNGVSTGLAQSQALRAGGADIWFLMSAISEAGRG